MKKISLSGAPIVPVLCMIAAIAMATISINAQNKILEPTRIETKLGQLVTPYIPATLKAMECSGLKSDGTRACTVTSKESRNSPPVKVTLLRTAQKTSSVQIFEEFAIVLLPDNTYAVKTPFNGTYLSSYKAASAMTATTNEAFRQASLFHKQLYPEGIRVSANLDSYKP